MKREVLLKALLIGLLALSPQTLLAGQDQIPDLSGNYDIATLTPLERPRMFGENLYLSKEAAEKITADNARLISATSRDSDPNREAPPTGGDGSRGAAGNVGGYNFFWIDRGDDAFEIDGKFRTSIIYAPSDGRRKLTEAGTQKRRKRFAAFRPNKGQAWWLKTGGQGPYDDPELRGLGERCLLGFGSTSGPPMLPVLYNNVKRIVQTPDHVMILTEMVHDARIIRLNSQHLPTEIRRWMGDSIGHWEGDTLVVDTTNFGSRPGLGLASENLHVVERFKRTDDKTLLYSFTVEDPTVWAEPWSGEYPWPATEHSVYEYACHEGNYALGNILRGARLLEAEAEAGGS
ncbi:MAG: hypothetical protein QGI68_01470 [Pseudomonadales bacterium]|jgi:hypothetical protein|nr:hypothetical protein [Pseudomonadales bacterium]MDP7360681.1 hypothetical protein [Pseudomonadales bacterium]MDP7594224.1 hypothetical protein [Pseudomonadales bacterium]HJN52927.1 hypothetical protein [Pseudomonadales bacterium]|tara:strand:- start:15104 stop:16141 length:1038 start_codon:yes stop_codon:yes gene_type:complete